MKIEATLTKGNKENWPVKFKFGLFQTKENGKFRLSLKFCPLFLLYFFIPRLLKFWLSFEKDIISVYFLDFIKMPERKI